jgi:3-hydroxyisobutyrate dehydrogenase
MGAPMAANLERAGFVVQSFDLRGTGNRRSIREAAEGADALVTMLPDGDAVREAVFEALPALSPGTVVIDMSSCDPGSTRALEAVLSPGKVLLIDAPVSGAVAKARDGTLAIMVGGSREALEKAAPVLRAMGRDLFHVGPLGAGHAVKALNNYLGAAGTLAGFEALLVAQRFGLDPQPMLEAINASTGRNSTTERKIPQQVLTGAFASGFRLSLMAKDVGIAAALARDLGVEAPYLRTTLRLWRAAQRALAASADHTEIFRYLQRLTKAATRAPRRATRKPARQARGSRPPPRRNRRSGAPARRAAAGRT